MSDELEAIRAKLRAEIEAGMEKPRPRGVIEIQDGALSALIAQNEWVFLDLWAPWCGPCRMFAPVFEAAEQRFGEHAVFAKMNVDQNPVTSQALQVQSIPTLMVFHHGKPVHRQAGALPGPMFEQLIEQALATA